MRSEYYVEEFKDVAARSSDAPWAADDPGGGWTPARFSDDDDDDDEEEDATDDDEVPAQPRRSSSSSTTAATGGFTADAAAVVVGAIRANVRSASKYWRRPARPESGLEPSSRSAWIQKRRPEAETVAGLRRLTRRPSSKSTKQPARQAAAGATPSTNSTNGTATTTKKKLGAWPSGGARRARSAGFAAELDKARSASATTSALQQQQQQQSGSSSSSHVKKKLVGVALWERLSYDVIEWTLRVYARGTDLGALGLAHRAFRDVAEQAAEAILALEYHNEDATRLKPRPLERDEKEPCWRVVRAAERGGLAPAVLAGGGSHELFVTTTTTTTTTTSTQRGGVVVARGRGNCGQLGLGADVFDAPTPTKVAMYPPTQKIAVVHVAAGAHASLAVDATGALWAWGKARPDNNGGGVDHEPRRVAFPRSSFASLIDLASGGTSSSDQQPRIAQCAVGAHHFLAVDRAGSVWSWGRNTHGQLGVGSPSRGTAHAPPRRIRSLRRAVAVAAGHFHSLVLDADGAVFAFGLGADGRLGLGHSLNAPLPERVLLPGKAECRIVQATASVAHSACVDAKGRVYAWGDVARGALGHRDLEASRSPRIVDALRGRRIVKAQCSLLRTLALDDDGVLWSVGGATSSTGGSHAAAAHVRRVADLRKHVPVAVLDDTAAPAVASGRPWLRDVALTSDDTLLVAVRGAPCYLEVAHIDALCLSAASGPASTTTTSGGGGGTSSTTGPSASSKPASKMIKLHWAAPPPPSSSSTSSPPST